MNTLLDAGISLLESEHKYFLDEDPSIEFKSVTQIVENYFEPFDKVFTAQKLVTTSPKYFGMDPDELIKQWDATAHYGTKVHKEIESYIVEKKTPDDIKAEKGVQWIKKYLDDPDKEVYPEVIVFNKGLKIAGSIDIIIFDKLLNQYEIVDWKTSKQIDMTSYYNLDVSNHSIAHLTDQECSIIKGDYYKEEIIKIIADQ